MYSHVSPATLLRTTSMPLLPPRRIALLAPRPSTLPLPGITSMYAILFHKGVSRIGTAWKRYVTTCLRLRVRARCRADCCPAQLYQHAFSTALCTEASEHPVLLTEPPLNPPRNREAMTQIMFEQLEVPSLYIAVTAVLSLYISGKETGLVIDCGHGSTQAVPVYESVVMAHAVQTVPVAGVDVDAELVRLLADKDISGGSLDCPRDVSAMKQAVWYVVFHERGFGVHDSHVHSYVAQDFEAERVAADKDGEPVRRSYTLPDGKAVSVASERFVASEVLFTPSLCGHDFAPGLGDAAQRAITYCDATLRPDLVNNVVLSGGCTMLPGFVDRFTTELQARLAPKQAADVSVPKLPERRYGAWVGGSILASLPLFDSLCVTNAEYEEQGPSFIHRKCG